MQTFSVFDIIGPRMTGPSSSHTAGAAKLGYKAYVIAGRDVKKVKLTLYGSFATTGRGHGTDKALTAGVLGLMPDDPRIKYATLLAQEADVEVKIVFDTDTETEHPNTAKIELTDSKGKLTEVIGASVGGGNILITSINGMEMELTGEYPSLIVKHNDRPGVITSVTSILAKEKVNVAFMRVFRSSKRADACMVIETDQPVSERTKQLILDWNEDIKGVLTVE